MYADTAQAQTPDFKMIQKRFLSPEPLYRTTTVRHKFKEETGGHKRVGQRSMHSGREGTGPKCDGPCVLAVV